MKSAVVCLVAVLLVPSALGCGTGELAPSGPPLASNQVLASNATVRFVDLEGGCWALETSTGRYEPIGLPQEFRKDGLAVYVVVHGAPQAVSICQMAPLVTLDSIRVR